MNFPTIIADGVLYGMALFMALAYVGEKDAPIRLAIYASAALGVAIMVTLIGALA